MVIRSIAGIEDEQGVGNIFKKAGNIFKKAGNLVKKGFQVFKTVNLAPVRASFMGLVAVNAFGLATKVNQLIQKGGFEAVKFWQQMGGDRTKLKRAAERGAKNKRIFGIDEIANEMGVGALPAVGAMVASATPVILKLNSVLKAFGISPAEVGKKALADLSKKKSSTDADNFENLTNVQNYMSTKVQDSRSIRRKNTYTPTQFQDNRSYRRQSTSDYAPANMEQTGSSTTSEPIQYDDPSSKLKKDKKILGMKPLVFGLVLGATVLTLGGAAYAVTRKKSSNKKR